ncbi:MAG: ATP-binding cassette domain-containing protein [Chloroflexota bacterium]|nr:ATP-binding cassette domain-containing protein [Chloroflexota bacterium]
MSFPLITYDRVTVQYPDSPEAALAATNWRVEEGAFALLAGPSGSGKSTLLRCVNGLVPHFTGGRFGGNVTVGGFDTRRVGPRTLSRTVGFVFQDPETQAVAQRVEDELAFGMEQLGEIPAVMRRRVEEVLDLLGIEALRYRDQATLSGGERQRVAIAAALAAGPRLLVLDEPTSQLDPWAAEEVLSALIRLNEEQGLTILLAEHRLERVVAHADQMRFLPLGGGAATDGSPREVLGRMPPVLTPPIVELGRRLGWSLPSLNVKEARARAWRPQSLRVLTPERPPVKPGEVAVSLRGVHLCYPERPILEEIDFEIRSGELVALIGRNGSGKTTLLRAIMGFHRPKAGRISVFGRDIERLSPAGIARDVGYVPQQPGSLLFTESLGDELKFTLKQHAGQGRDPETLLADFGLSALAERHPRDLSGGERERAALAAILVANPRLLLLDEPTRGMDAERKIALGQLLRRLTDAGVAVILATHDVELTAQVATRVVLLGGGEIVADGGPRQVLTGSLTHGTQINRAYGGELLTVADALRGQASEEAGTFLATAPVHC